MESTATAEEKASFIIGLYSKYGDADYIGEPVSQVEHMVQCAQLAEAEAFDQEVILAALFHDIGHFCEYFMDVQQMDGYGVVDHEALGATFLRQMRFPEKIPSLVENHVAAKRYLTFKYPAYFDQLSEASKKTLEFQGGIMTAEEASAFEADPLFDIYIKLRRWDEQAKIENQPMPAMDKYFSMIVSTLNA